MAQMSVPNIDIIEMENWYLDNEILEIAHFMSH